MRSKCILTSSIRKFSCSPLGRSGDSRALPPPPGPRMTRVRDFVADLARAGKSFSEIKKTVAAAYGDRSLSSSQLYRIIKQARVGKDTEDQRHLNPKKRFARRLSPPPWPPP
jgi:hypothetical protein